MNKKIGWIIGGSFIFIFAMFYLLATTVLSPEATAIRKFERFQKEYDVQLVRQSEVFKNSSGRLVQDFYFGVEAKTESETWEIENSLWEVVRGLPYPEVAVDTEPDINYTKHTTPEGYKKIAEIQWNEAPYDNKKWPFTYKIRVRKYR